MYLVLAFEPLELCRLLWFSGATGFGGADFRGGGLYEGAERVGVLPVAASLAWRRWEAGQKDAEVVCWVGSILNPSLLMPLWIP